MPEASPSTSSEAKIFLLKQPLIFRISGRDATRYLHGRLTQNIKAMQDGSALETLLLTPQGKVQGKLWCMREADSYLFVSTSTEEIIEALLRFKVADDVAVEVISPTITALQIVNPQQADRLLHELADLFQLSVFNTSWGDLSCALLVLRAEELPEIRSNLAKFNLSISSQNEREWLRISNLIPESGTDLSEEVSAPEIPLAHLVSFNKGCYAGQEVVEMATARGRPNRKLIGLEFQAEDAPAIGAKIFAIETDGTKSQKSIGTLSSITSAPATDADTEVTTSRNRALAFVKYSLADDTPLLIEDIPATKFQ